MCNYIYTPPCSIMLLVLVPGHQRAYERSYANYCLLHIQLYIHFTFFLLTNFKLTQR